MTESDEPAPVRADDALKQPSRQDRRAQAEADALRENLRRRKEQARARQAAVKDGTKPG